MSKTSSLLDQVRERGYLVVGINYANPPFGHLVPKKGAKTASDYELQGFDIALSQEIARRLLPQSKTPVRFRQVLTSTRLVAVNTQAVDMIAASMSITPNRKQRVDFSAPYFTIHQAVMVPLKSPIDKPVDLHQKTILTVNGSTAQARIRNLYPDSHVVGYASLEEAFEALSAGEGDALTNDDVLLSGIQAQNCKAAKQYRLLPQTLSDEHYGLVFRKSGQNGDSASLLQAVNVILEDMAKDGTLLKLQQQWIQGDCMAKV